jgi:hypothetical protein
MCLLFLSRNTEERNGPGQGELSLAEIKAAVLSLQLDATVSTLELEALLRAMDSDLDGRVAREELKQFLLDNMHYAGGKEGGGVGGGGDGAASIGPYRLRFTYVTPVLVKKHWGDGAAAGMEGGGGGGGTMVLSKLRQAQQGERRLAAEVTRLREENTILERQLQQHDRWADGAPPRVP